MAMFFLITILCEVMCLKTWEKEYNMLTLQEEIKEQAGKPVGYACLWDEMVQNIFFTYSFWLDDKST